MGNEQSDGLIRFATMRYRFMPDYEDIIQEAAIGLWEAERDYDPAKGTKLETYAVARMRGKILHYLRDKVRLIRIPAWAQERGGVFPRAEFFADVEGLV
jgi:RNA polymerase sigma factor (sigma-70 family)